MGFSGVAIALLLGPVHQPDCEFDKATYVDRAGSGYTIRADAEGRVTLIRVSSSSTGATYTFNVAQGEGYSAAHLQPHPARERQVGVPMPIYAVAENLSVQGNFPRPNDPAPRYLFAPELGQTLWYGAEALGGPPLAEKREELPRTFFELTRCD